MVNECIRNTQEGILDFKCWKKLVEKQDNDNRISTSLNCFCETRSKRSAQVYRGRNLHPSPLP